MAADPLSPPHTFTVDFHLGEDGTPVLVCRGRMIAGCAGLFRSEVKKLLPRYPRVIADLSRVSYVDSAGLGALVAAYLSARSAGCDLTFLRLSDRIKDLLRLTRLTALFEGRGQHV